MWEESLALPERERHLQRSILISGHFPARCKDVLRGFRTETEDLLSTTSSTAGSITRLMKSFPRS